MSAVAPVAMAEELEAARQKKRRKKHRRQAEAAAASSESPRPPVTPDSKPEPPAPVAPETLTSPAVAAGKERKRRKEVAAALVKVAMRKEEKMKRKRSKHEEAAPTPSPSAASKILEVAAEGAMERKERRRVKAEQGQSGQPPVPDDVHPQVGEAAADDGVSGNQSVQRGRIGKPLVQTGSEILKMKIETLKQQKMPRFIPTMANFNSIEHDPNCSSPFGAFFDQFRYKPEHRQGHNAPSVPKMPYRPARPPTRDRPPSLSDQLTANDTFMAAKTTISDTEQPHSASASGSQEEVKVKAKKGSEKKMDGMKKPRKPVLTKADKCLDMYRRLPLDKLVSPPHSPHKLLQEGYADDPWKVIVICMLLNRTKGKPVKEKVEGFFKRYPDAQTAYTADPDKMAEYLTPLGLQRVKADRIQKFSKAYIGEEWEYVTELCGVGKYAADAYAIFCAGRAKDVNPKDHKLVDYWKYVRFELPSTQASQNVQEAAGVTRQGNFAPVGQQISVRC